MQFKNYLSTFELRIKAIILILFILNHLGTQMVSEISASFDHLIASQVSIIKIGVKPIIWRLLCEALF